MRLSSTLLFILISYLVIGQNPIKVNQFGYRPNASKVAVLSDPQIGFNSTEEYTPSSTIELRRFSDNAVVYSASPEAWNNGALHDQSGDKVWWFDFSSVKESGDYYVHDPVKNVSSYRFSISESVYKDVLKQVIRAFYYQRSGVEKVAPYAESGWTDVASFQGPDQDKFCRSATDKNNPATAKDLSGGWYDAGDYNKYVNFTYSTLHNLLFAYEQNPEVFTDDFNIPESGNGIPDIIDEIKWELDWLLKMQLADGSVLMKVSHPNFESASPASQDDSPTYYGVAQLSSTLSFCSILSHASIVFAKLNDDDLNSYAENLKFKALKAWDWSVANPAYSNYQNEGFASATPEVSTYDQDMRKLTSAVYLWELTEEASYKDYIDAHYSELHGYQWGFWYPYEQTYQEALIRYANNPNSTTQVSNNLLSSFSNSVHTGNDFLLPAYEDKRDAYRAYLSDDDYIWGSNQVKAQTAMLFYNMDYYNLDTFNRIKYRDAAEQYIHFISGVNPLALALITHMDNHGAENSIREIYHSWFGDGTDFDNASTSLYGPPPGYLPGGFNKYFQPDPAYSGPPLSPPTLQPIQKSYKDWNTSWPQNSWELTEVSIYVQAAFARLLSYYTQDGIITKVTNQILQEDLFIITPTISSQEIKITSLQSDFKEANYQVTDIKGSTVLKGNIQHKETNISIVKLLSGTYFITLNNKDLKQTLKFIKQ